MKTFVWKGNSSARCAILPGTIPSNIAVVQNDENWTKFDGNLPQVNENLKFFFVREGCAYEIDGTLDEHEASIESSEKIYLPLASLKVSSIKCKFGVFGALTFDNRCFMWGQSNKGQCGYVEPFIKHPRMVEIKSKDVVCVHGVRQGGGTIHVSQLDFGRTLSVAVGLDGSLWSWGATFGVEDPVIHEEPYQVLINRRVIDVVCGESHYLALVQSSTEATRQNGGAVTSRDSYCLTEICLKCCGESRNLQKSVQEEQKKRDIPILTNFDDDDINFCPLGLKLEFADQTSFIESNSPKKPLGMSTYLNFSASSTPTKRPIVADKHSASFDDAEQRSFEMVDIRKTKSNVCKRFSFISFDFNAGVADSTSSSNETLLDSHTNSFWSGEDWKNGYQSKYLSATHQMVHVSTEVWTWGVNDHGQLGLGDFIKRSQPFRIDKLNNSFVCKLDAGELHSLAVTATGEVYVWGSDAKGQIKQYGNVQSSPVLFKIGSQSSVFDAAAGRDFSVLLVNDFDYRPEFYYCGRNYEGEAPVVVRLSNWTKVCNGLPFAVRCSEDLVVLPLHVDENRRTFARFNEFLFTEIKFAQKLKQLNVLAVELHEKNVLSDAKETELCEDFLLALRKFCHVVVKCVYAVKTAFNEESSIARSFLAMQSSEEYSCSLKNLHTLYCRMIASNVFHSFKTDEELEASLRQLAALNDVESSRETRLLRKLYNVPFNRLREYCEIAMSILNSSNVSYEDREWLTNFVKRTKIFEQLLTNFFIQAEKTHHFWSHNSTKVHIMSLKTLTRFLVKEFTKADGGISSVNENSSSTWFQDLIVFSDCLVISTKNSVRSYEFPLLWLVPVSDDVKFNVQIICPESLITIEFIDGVSKNAFLMSVSQALVRFANGPYTEIMSTSSSPSLRRKARYTFSSKHTNFANATYFGSWILGKPHGTGVLVWIDGRQFRGKFKDGLMHGFGEMTNQNETTSWPTVRGYWKDSQLSGLAIVDYFGGTVYEGYVKNGVHEGHGVLRKRSQTYFGAWSGDKRRGYGVCDRGKEKYLGMWDNDKEHGVGCLVTLDGVFYEGNFENGIFIKGRMISQDGTKYDGEFNGAGILAGKGSILFHNGDKVTGQLNGAVNDCVKIVNGEYSRTFTSPASTPLGYDLDLSSNYCIVAADDKWLDIFAHVCDGLVCDSLTATEQIWDNLVSNLQKLHRFFESHDRTKSSNDLRGLDVIPDWDRPFDSSYYAMVKSYCLLALRRPYHPLGRLLSGLTDVFNASYSGVGAHASLLPQAIAEIRSMVRRTYEIIRLLFPSLPNAVDMNRLIVEAPNDLYNEPNDFETFATFLYDSFLEGVYPNLFTLYVLHNDNDDGRFWSRIKTLNARNDVALLDMFNVDKQLWPIRLSDSIRDSNVLDAPLICATAKSKYYADAIECLQRLSSEFYPSSKLKVVVETFYHINACVSNFSTDQTAHMWSADSLVPVTMYVVVRSQIQRLGAEIKMIEDFSPQLVNLGQVQYLLATLQGCYKHVMEDKNLF